MSQVYPVPEAMAEHSYINDEQYVSMYERSISDPDAFWSEQADKFLQWEEKWQSVSSANFEAGQISWFLGAKLNVHGEGLRGYIHSAPVERMATRKIKCEEVPRGCSSREAPAPAPDPPGKNMWPACLFLRRCVEKKNHSKKRQKKAE